MYTAPQLSYLAHWLTRRGPAETALLTTAAQSRVDLNPHQVEAALFALRGTERSSAFAKGVLLADEVGLGKTIEAGLVLAQHWAAKRRRLLLVVPASLRKQWQQELADKFLLPASVIDAQTAKSVRGNPFAQESIVVVSYEYAARRSSDLAEIDWHLVVFDEAHRLRSLHRDAARATSLLAALGHRQKILLTATPFQNSLVELWSLVHFIDQDYLGDRKSFELQYRGRNIAAERLADLGRRMQPICQRMLRRQVAADGHIQFTRRYALTFDFSPTPEEAELYRRVSDWLQDMASVAFPSNGRHLVTLVIRKILASSSFAIDDTLKTVIDRLEQRAQLALDDLAAEDTSVAAEDERTEVAASTIHDVDRLRAELAEIRSHRELASRIERNAKGEALLTALTRAFASNEVLPGSSRKAVIFTESVRTQAYLKALLEAKGYAGKVVLLNGQNSDATSSAIYQEWRKRHQGSARISGSKTADMKAAIVDAFRDDYDILIATESGAEGINLQFCQILVNYDLPWNPQRIEQRIGRVHRYGQKCDVFVVNFVNTDNQVDRLVYEILSRKLRLFEGVFGASDEVLGAVEAGIDLERRINEILECRRGADEVEAAFAELRAELDEVIRAVEAQTREKVLAGFDHEVQRLLHDRRSQTAIGLDERQLHWLAFLQGALGAEADVRDGTVVAVLGGQRYATDWARASSLDVNLVRADQSPFAEALAHWRRSGAQGQRLRLHRSRLKHTFVDLDPLVNRCGVLRCVRLHAPTFDAGDYLLVAACDAEGKRIDPGTAQRLLLVPGEAVAAKGLDTGRVAALADELLQGQLAALDAQNRRWFDQESERLDRWGEDQNAAREIKIKDLERQLKDARRVMRAIESFEERVTLKREIARLESERDQAMVDFYAEKKRIGQQVDALVEDALARLKFKPEVEVLYTVEWELCP